jgi:hypothetical protein
MSYLLWGPPVYPSSVISIFKENPRRYSQIKVRYWYQPHRRQVDTGIFDTGDIYRQCQQHQWSHCSRDLHLL